MSTERLKHLGMALDMVGDGSCDAMCCQRGGSEFLPFPYHISPKGVLCCFVTCKDCMTGFRKHHQQCANANEPNAPRWYGCSFNDGVKVILPDAIQADDTQNNHTDH